MKTTSVSFTRVCSSWTVPLLVCACGASHPTTIPDAQTRFGMEAQPVAQPPGTTESAPSSGLDPSVQPETSEAQSAEPGRVIVGESGSAPMQRLRYAPTEHTERYRVSLSNKTEFTIDGKPVPDGLGLAFALDVIATSAPGPAITWHVTRVEGESQNAVIGVRFRVKADDTGRIVEQSIDDHAPFDPAATILASNLGECLTELILPVPQDDVGQGASWSIETPIDRDGLSGVATKRYRLLGTGARAAISGTQEAVGKRQVATRVEDLKEGENRTDSNIGNVTVDAWFTPSSLVAEGTVRQTISINGVIRKGSQLVHVDSRSMRECVVKSQ